MAGFSPIAGPGLPGNILKKKKEEEEQNVTQKYSPVAAPGTSLKNTEKKITNKNGSGSEKKSGSATGGGKAAGRSPAVSGAYSPVVGVPDPLERLRNRISGGTKEAADLYRGGAARRRTNVPAAGKTVDPVTADYLSRVSPVTRTLEKHGLSSGSDFDRILSMNRVAARQDREQAIQALLDRGKAQNGNKHFLRNGYEGTVRERLAQEKEKEQKVARRYDRMLQREVEKKYGLDPYTSTLSDIQEVIWKNEKSINSAKTQEDAEALVRDNQILGGMLGKDSIYRETERGKQLVQFEALDEQPDFFSRQSVNKKERDRVYRVINNVDGFGDYVKAYEEGGAVPQVSSGKTFSYVDTDDRKYLFMTALEKSRYNYLYNTEGKRAAKEYLNLLEPDLNKRQTEDKVKSAAAFAQKHPVAASVISLAEAPARGIGGVISTVGDVGGVLSGKEIDPYSKYKQLAHTAQAVRETVSSSLDKDWQRFLYNAGMSIGDNVIEMGVMSLLTVGAAPALKAIDNAADLSKAVSALNKITKYGVSSMVFGDVAASAVIDGKAKGYSDEKALGLGLVSALIEGATEKWSLDVLLKKPKTLFTSVLRGMAAEGSEEGLSAAANMAVDGLVNGSDADIAKRIEELKQDGYSDMGALTLALTEGILPDMVAGALGGGLMGGMHDSVSKLLGGKQQKTKSGKNGVTFDDIIYIGNEGTNKNAKNGADNDLLLSIGQNGQKKKRYGSLLALENRARFSNAVDGVFDGSYPESSSLVLGGTPPLLQKYGAGDVPLTVSVSAVFKMAYPTGYLGLKHGHNLGIAAVKHLPEQISSPLAILRSNSVDGSLVLLTEWADRNDNRVVVPVHLNKNGVLGVENRVTSAHGRDIKPLLTDRDGNSTVLYTKGNESIDSLLASSGLQLPGAQTAISGQLPSLPSEDTLIDYSISRKSENYNPDLQKNGSNSQTGKNGDAFDEIINIRKEETNKNAKNSADNDLLFSINYDKNNVPFVEVDNDVLAGLTQKEKQAKVKEILKDRFSQGVSAGNEQIQITKKSRNEFLNSGYTQSLRKNRPSIYNDKLRSSDNLDEIVQASRDYVGEEKKHPRKDSIREFARGKVNLRVGGKDYSADVIVGTTKTDHLVFYDLINFKPIKINERAPVTRKLNNNYSNNSLDEGTLSDSSIPQTTEKNNPDLQKNGSNSQTGENGSAPSFLIDTQENQTQDAESSQEKQKISLNAFRRVVEALGYRVIDAPRAERVKADVDLESIDGYVDYKLGEVYINPNAQNPQNVVMKHELTHVMERVSTKYLKQAGDYIKTTLPDVWERTRQQVIDKYDRLGIDVSEHLESETMAEIASEFSTDKAINRYGTSARFCRNISLWFSYMAKKIKSVFGDLTVADKLEIAAYKWEQALRRAEKGANSGTGGVVYAIKKDKNGNEYWEIDSGKDIFKNLKSAWKIRDEAFKFLLGNRDNKVVVHDENGKEIRFIRVSAQEFTQSEESHDLYENDPENFKRKMRMIPSLQDILLHSPANWHSPDLKNHKMFQQGGFENYRGRVRVDNVIFNTVVRVGVADFGNVFYDINLEVDTILPHAKGASEIKNRVSTSNDSVSQGETSVNNNFMQNEENDATLDFLLAGEKAKTHDPAALDKAKRLSAFGETPRQIWKETGWVKGQEGKWRFELDDSKMKFRKKDGKICDVLRISELNFQSMTEGLSDAESDEFLRLRQAASRGELSAPLSDVISYDLLFEAYPALKDVLVKSDYHAVGMGKAAYDSGTKTIYLSPQANGAKLRQTLLHEIQHAVQDEEGFSFGSSPNYWRERSGVSAQEAERLYRNTAGEIEARDVENRADLTEEERRETFPASAEPNDDVVFAGEETGNGGINYAHGFGGLTQYTEKEKKNWKNSKTILVYSNLEQFKEFVNRVLGNVDIEKKMYFGKIPENVASRILHDTGIDVSDLNVSLKGYEIRKILLNSHGDKRAENLRGQEPVNVNDLLNIPSIITQPDRISLTEKQYEGKPALLFEKNINGKNYVLTYVSRKHHDLAIQTMYKNRSLSSAENANAFSFTSETTAGTASTDSVSQGETSVNSYSMQTQENNAPERTISQLADELEEIDRLLDNEDLSDEEYRKLERKTRKLEREISILTARRAAQPAQTARTAGNSGVPISYGNLLEDSGQQGAADSSIELSQDFGDYPYDMQNVLKGYFNGVDKRILDFVNQHKKGNFERLNLDPVSDRLKEDIRELTGQNLDGYIFAMNSNAVEHIQQRHGKFGAADHSMAHSDDIARALYVLNYYDDVRLLRDANGSPVFSQEFKNADGLPANMVLFSKKINGTYYAAVAVPESKYKKMWLVTAYINKKGVTQVPNDELSSLRSTSETELASPPNDSVSQGETSVNSYSMQTQENNAFDRIMRMSGGNKEKRITFDDLVGRNF